MCGNSSNAQQRVSGATEKADSEEETSPPAVGIGGVFLEEAAFEMSRKRSVGFVHEELEETEF